MKTTCTAHTQWYTSEQANAALTTIFTQVDPKFAKGFKTVASSYLDVVKSVNSWMQATAGLGSLDKIFSLSTVIMTGNVLGAPKWIGLTHSVSRIAEHSGRLNVDHPPPLSTQRPAV